jgi:hypothetical protein
MEGDRMPDSPSKLPARPSLEQLSKQAKDLLRKCRAGESNALQPGATLADAQFAVARQYGFGTWAKLKQHIASIRPEGLKQFEQLAQALADAYSSGDSNAIRNINWKYGTSFVWEHKAGDMQRHLPQWFAADNRTPELALSDAQNIVANSYGFGNWSGFVESFRQERADPRSAPVFISNRPPFYKINWEEERLTVRGPQSDADWDEIIAVINEHRISRLDAGGIGDDAMKRISRVDCLTDLGIGSKSVTDDGLLQLARMPQLLSVSIGGWSTPITDRGLAVLSHLTNLRRFGAGWTQGISDKGLSHLARCEHLEEVNVMGTPSGDGAIQALAGKTKLHLFRTGANVTDAGLALFHQFPMFKTWHGGELQYNLMTFDPGPTFLMIDGPFTNSGLSGLAGLDGLFGLTFFWHCPAFTSAGLEPLKHLANLGFLGCQDQHCDNEAMRHIAEIPRLRMLMGQGAVADDDGFEALGRSSSIEYIWGRDCPNFAGRGFASLARLPSLRGFAISCKNVGDDSLSLLPKFPALRQFMPMDVSDAGFKHVGRCKDLEALWCMYCRDTGDAATGHIGKLKKLKHYYAGQTKITDRSLEILGRMASLERLEFWNCDGLTDAGIAQLVTLPNLKEVSLDGLRGVTKNVLSLFPSRVRVNYSS